MFKSKLSKVIVSLLRRIAGVTRSGAKRLMRAMLQALMAMGRRAKLPVAGFVLPTVTMVLLVVILLTVAIVLRSFDRANLARNVRVNQQVLAAATPALDRAKAKIEYMLREDPQRPTATPSDAELYRMMSDNAGATNIYTFGDENRLKVKFDLDGIGGIGTDLPLTDPLSVETNESINTAWRYAVDTDNDTIPDTYTIYGIFFRSPPRVGLDFKRVRKPLEARTPPMSGGSLKPGCEAGGTSASLVGDSGWYKIDGKLKKSFFVYTVNVPMPGFKGTPSISALEYQQDQSRIPLSNNAVVYEDDLEISPGPTLRLNGRMITNSNLIVTTTRSGETLNLYQVSSKDSCFYEQENSKIIVGGNVVNGWSGNNNNKVPVQVHLFKKGDNPDYPKVNLTIDDKNQSTSNNALDVMYNNRAYADRIAALVSERIRPAGATSDTDPLTDPISVQDATKPTGAGQKRPQALEEYFKNRTRKVPFGETAFGVNGTGGVTTGNLVDAGSEGLRPKPLWVDPSTALTLLPAELKANQPEPPLEEETFIGDRVVVGNNLPSKIWNSTKKQFETASLTFGTWQPSIPDRKRESQVIKLADVGATDRDGFWERSSAQIPKTPLDGIGGLRIITSAGVYDRATSFLPPPKWIDHRDAPGTPLAITGRTGQKFVNDPPTTNNTYDDPTTTGVEERYPVVWPDSMPMSPLGPGSKVYDNVATANNWILFPGSDAIGTGLPVVTSSTIDPKTPKFAKGDLRMRASAVYHYANDGYKEGQKPKQIPFACVSSYYDPSTAATARNISGLLDVSGDTVTPLPATGPNFPTTGRFIGSHNGIVYSFPGRPPLAGPLTTTNGLLSGGDPIYTAQANYVFPDGRFANKPLREALLKDPNDRNLDDLAAIDSTACALNILQNPTASTAIPPGAIQEVAFLNAREIKAVDADNTATPNVNEEFTLSSPLPTTTPATAPAAILTGFYNLPMEERQPLEVRATQLDIEKLRGEEFTGSNGPAPAKEYLLPNSGIIYASRDDALPDRSARSSDETTARLVSPTDSLLDPTRKPNGIVVINGQSLFRGKPGPVRPNPYTVADVVREKGLTLVSNLPVYIKGDFNKHSQEEFVTPLDKNTWSNFYSGRGALNPNFACRPGDPRLKDCTVGDNWRPATVLADAITLLSKDYRFGFRNEGDFDLRNNAGAAAVLPRRQQGFYHNNFITNGLTSGAFLIDGTLPPVTPPAGLKDDDYKAPKLNSSYFNNFVTPVQRRGEFPEYLMETCIKLPVSECTDADWFVDPQTGRKVSDVIATTPTYNSTTRLSTYKAGTTADPPIPELQRFPRRLAFPRDSANNLNGGATPQPYGINGGTVDPANPGTPKPNSLWFATTATASGTAVSYGNDPLPFVVNRNLKDWNNITDLPVLSTTQTFQPLLMPMLQIQTVAPATDLTFNKLVKETGWLPRATPTSFHLLLGSGDTPSRALDLARTSGDTNGGLQNLPRFLESWNVNNADVSTDIKGSFIQLNRSAYSTSPYQPILLSVTGIPPLKSLFARPATSPIPAYTAPQTTYRTDGGGRFAYFVPPKRDWGFDVGLLSQPPDLFTQRLTTPPRKIEPDEYFREVSRDDKWIQTLMCAELAANPGTFAVDAPFKPSQCPPPA
ncbi:hormogonium polysaccharide biosynthesis protein HpsA [Microcoleus sp. CAWBG58]|uniref:hormogonium polysaccharide biosynthesis protein HpsA n=1 Tax=Microcoleus sp. CAWBG58 TaxID=2841651 RepID=UPI0025CF8A30|nr:hormogonium polysaccharide biosynthesis protein HpsA [Microcoleus sp. CAWBG58]